MEPTASTINRFQANSDESDFCGQSKIDGDVNRLGQNTFHSSLPCPSALRSNPIARENPECQYSKYIYKTFLTGNQPLSGGKTHQDMELARSVFENVARRFCSQ